MLRNDRNRAPENLGIIDLEKAKISDGKLFLEEDSRMKVEKKYIAGAKTRGTCNNCYNKEMEVT